ncbi:MAG: helix-hairpin-helix domain-containing protein [Polyangiaceae bacterium]|nr:helix-hairpin-helix domain-containing protein [Polyangiaceae bacterium]
MHVGIEREPAPRDPRGDLPTAVDGGPGAAPVLSRWRRWYSESLWAPAAAKLAGVGLGMILLAGIGTWSLARRHGPVTFVLPSASAALLRHDLGEAWLAATEPGRERSGGGTRPAHGTDRAGEPEAPAAIFAGLTTAPSATAPPGADPCARRGHGKIRWGATPGTTADGRVVLNLATAEEIAELPGIGLRRAEEIVRLREKRGGRFRHVNDLLRVRGIGVRALKRMRERMLLDPPPGAPAAGAVAPSGSASAAHATSAPPVAR